MALTDTSAMELVYQRTKAEPATKAEEVLALLFSCLKAHVVRKRLYIFSKDRFR